MKGKNIIIVLLILLLSTFVYSRQLTIDYNNALTRSTADDLYCLRGGDCVLNNLVLNGNISFIGQLINITIVNQIINGSLTIDNGNLDLNGNNITNVTCINGGIYEKDENNITMDLCEEGTPTFNIKGNIETQANTTTNIIKINSCTVEEVTMGTTGQCINLNATIEDKIKSITYNATNITTLVGTLDGGNLSSIQKEDDGEWYNVSENAGGTPNMIIIINFTNVTNFDSFNFDVRYDDGSGHNIAIGIYECNDDDYEEQYPPNIFDTSGEMAHFERSVIDAGNHICGTDNTVSIRFNHVSNGNPAHDFFIGFIELVKGASTSSPVETDPFSIHTDGDVMWQGNEQGNGFNSTGWNTIESVNANISNTLFTTNITTSEFFATTIGNATHRYTWDELNASTDTDLFIQNKTDVNFSDVIVTGTLQAVDINASGNADIYGKLRKVNNDEWGKGIYSSSGLDDAVYTAIITDNTNAIVVGGSDTGQTVDLNLMVSVAGAEYNAMKIDGATGNIGIGFPATNSPSSRLYVDGDINTTTIITNNITSDDGTLEVIGDLSSDNLVLGDASTSDNIFVYFNDDALKDEYIQYFDAISIFIISAPLTVDGRIVSDGVLSSNDIFTNGAGDDLWLGTATQSASNFKAYANGSLNIIDATATTSICLTDGTCLGDAVNINNTDINVNITDGNTRMYIIDGVVTITW